MATKEEVQKGKPVYEIMTAAWGIVKNHAGIELRQDSDQEWGKICEELVDLSQMGETPGERAMASGVARAVFNYYDSSVKGGAIA